jgi:predicted metal-binding protein
VALSVWASGSGGYDWACQEVNSVRRSLAVVVGCGRSQVEWNDSTTTWLTVRHDDQNRANRGLTKIKLKKIIKKSLKNMETQEKEVFHEGMRGPCASRRRRNKLCEENTLERHEKKKIRKMDEIMVRIID